MIVNAIERKHSFTVATCTFTRKTTMHIRCRSVSHRRFILFDTAQCQSKLQLLMKTYELSKFVSGLSGVGIDSDQASQRWTTVYGKISSARTRRINPCFACSAAADLCMKKYAAFWLATPRRLKQKVGVVNEFLEFSLDALPGQTPTPETRGPSSGIGDLRVAEEADDELADQPASHTQ